MARRASPPLPKQPARLSVGEMRRALPKLQRRLDQVNAIDPKQATRTYTAEFEAIKDNANATLMEIFGPDSTDYDRFKILSIYAGPHSYSREMPRHEVIEGYEEGKKRALIKLDTAITFINEKLADADGDEGQQSRVTGSTIFVGHGRSPIWRELREFLKDRLKLSVDEFNSVPIAGVATASRLEEMLDGAAFAFLIMTAEDERPDGTLHARMNVVHEAGLFQGRLGFKKAIILLEDGCEEFSNIHGLGYIPFPKGNISAKFEEIRQVLEREGLPAAP
jgi:predicted nucleotide-binding protein